jgi:L-fuculose-phosphate aldolase
LSPAPRNPSGEGGEPGKRNIGSGRGRAAASTRLQAIRIALSHDLVRAGRILDRRGMIVASEGNLSARLGPDRFLITRRGRRKGEMKTRDLVELSIDGASDPEALEAASTEHRVHQIAYRVRADVEAVVHAHPVALTAYAVRGVVPDLTRFDEARAFVGPIALVDYGPSGSAALADAVGRALAGPGRPNLVILSNHGALALGRSVDEALSRLEIANHLAAALLAAEGRSIGWGRE